MLLNVNNYFPFGHFPFSFVSNLFSSLFHLLPPATNALPSFLQIESVNDICVLLQTASSSTFPL